MYQTIDQKLKAYLNEDIGKLLLRVSFAVLMLFHGMAKVFHGVGMIAGILAKAGLPEFLAYGVYLAEVILPLMIIAGFYTRLSALVTGITMVFAIFLVFADKLFMLGKTGAPIIEVPLMYLLLSIVIFVVGAGKYSMDEKE